MKSILGGNEEEELFDPKIMFQMESLTNMRVNALALLMPLMEVDQKGCVHSGLNQSQSLVQNDKRFSHPQKVQ